MKTHYTVEGEQVTFIITELDSRYYQGIQDLGFTATETGFSRTFVAAPLHLDKILDNFNRCMIPLILQKGGLQATPWQDGLLRLLKRIEGQSIDWCLVGSAALAVRGLAVNPGDIDLVTGEADALRLGDLLLDDLVQPVQDSTGWIGKWFARAFPGACLEWVGGVNDSADAYGPSDFGPIALSQLETVV